MEKDSFKIAVLSGKGGVGKSLLASSLAILFSENGFRGKEESLLAVDADADAPNLDIWLGGVEKWDKIIPVFASEKPVIDYQKCDGCGLCAKHCKFGAIKMINGRPVINPMLCEGCGVCEQVCPRKAIHLEPVQNGEIRIKDFSDNSRILISSFLLPGEASSGRIVDELLKKAEEFVSPLAFIDTAPGTGCPVKAVLRKSHAVIAIAEPSVASFSDLKKVLEVVSFFKLPYWIVLNKIGINPSLEKKMRAWAGEKLLGEITYDSKIFQAVSHFTPIVKTKLKAKKEIEEIYSRLESKISF
jgi:MinD superfamily P-loop ATPase